MTADTSRLNGSVSNTPLDVKNPIKPVEESKSWNGHCISVIKDAAHLVGSGVKAVSYAVLGVTQSFFFVTGSLFNQAPLLADMFRRFDRQIFALTEKVTDLPGFFNKFKGTLGPTIGVIDTLQLASDADYVLNERYKTNSVAQILGRASIMVANAGGAILWLRQMGFKVLGSTANVLGELRVFSFMPKVVSSIPKVREIAGLQQFANKLGDVRVFSVFTKVSLETVVTRAVTVAFAFFAVDAMQRIAKSTKIEQTVQATLDLAYYISELALDALITFGSGHVIALGAVAATSVFFGLASFVYKIHHRPVNDPIPEALQLNF